jgi:hypothetical protein
MTFVEILESLAGTISTGMKVALASRAGDPLRRPGSSTSMFDP